MPRQPTFAELRDRSAPDWEARQLGDDALDARLASLLRGAVGPMTYFLSRHKRAATDPDQAPVLVAELQKALRKLHAIAIEAQPFADVKLQRLEAEYHVEHLTGAANRPPEPLPHAPEHAVESAIPGGV